MNTRYARLLALLLCFVITPASAAKGVLEGPALTNKLLDMGFRNPESTKRINVFHWHNWRIVDNQRILIEKSPRKHYMVEFSHACSGLKFADAIGIKRFHNSITTLDTIMVYDDFGWMPRHCFIESLYSLDKLSKKERKQRKLDKANQNQPKEPSSSDIEAVT